MRHLVASLFVVGCMSTQALSSQATAADQGIGACSILTKELALKGSTAEGKRLVENGKVYENQLGTNSCKRGRIALVIDPFPKPEQTRKSLGKQWQPVPGIGDAAYYWPDVFGHMYVFDRSHHFQLLVSLGPDDTHDVVKANAITLAKEVVAKLK